MDVQSLSTFPDLVVPYPSDYQLYSSLFISIQSFAATFILSCVLWMCLNQLSVVQRPSSLFIINLCIGDFINCFHLMTLGFQNFPLAGWTLGYKACLASGVIHMTCSSVSLISAGSITLERYLAIVHGRAMDFWMCIGLIASAWGIGFVGAFYLFASGYEMKGFVLKPGMTYCTLAWYTSDPITLILIYLVVFAVLAIISFILYANWRIVGVLKRTRSSVRISNTSRSPPRSNSGLPNQKRRPVEFIDWLSNGFDHSFIISDGNDVKLLDRAVNLKAAFIVFSFLFSWIPYVALIFFCILTRRPASPTFDTTCTLFLTFQLIMDPLIIVAFDNRFNVYNDLKDSF